MLMNTTFLGDSFSIKWQSREDAENCFYCLIFYATIQLHNDSFFCMSGRRPERNRTITAGFP